MREAVSLRDLYAEYHDRVNFLVIYIREAHPKDGWATRETDIRDPQTIEERRKIADQCEAALQHGIHTYVDNIDDAAMTAYAAWPERLYLIGTDQRVAYAGGRGPKGFSPEELKQAIDNELA